MKKTVFWLCLLALAVLLLLPCAAADPVAVLDHADLFTDEEEATVAAALEKPVKNVKYLVVTGTESSYPSDADAFAACGLSREDQAVVLWIRRVNTTYYYDMYTFGKADRRFSDHAVNKILDDSDVHSNLKGGRLVAGTTAFLRLADRHLALRPLRACMVGLIAGVIAGGGSMLGVWLSYRKKQHGESYPLDRYAKLALTQRQDIFVGRSVTRVRIQETSSSHGSGGGGGGFSGGHRGGR